MRPSVRLAQVLALLLAPSCAPPLDDEACVHLEPGAECPSEEEASEELVGNQTCETPMRKVVATGAFLYEQELPIGGQQPVGEEVDIEKQCCYEAAYRTILGSNCVVGRPLREGGEMISAREQPRSDWSAASVLPEVRGLTEAERATLSAEWRQAALLEHASVPAFARLVLDLVSLGAPAELVAQASRAMSDEVEHARACFALASAYAGQPVGPSALPLPEHRAPSLIALAVESFEEGCVGETLAAALAAAQREGATDPAVQRVLAKIVQDEARHAELAWDVLRWTLQQGGEPVRHTLLAKLAELEMPTIDLPAQRTAGTRGHGLVPKERAEEVLAAVLTQVILPIAEDWLSTSGLAA